MIYVFAGTVIYALVKKRKQIFSQKRNMALFLILTDFGFSLGVLHMVNPYLPSITSYLEKYMK